MTVGIWGRGWGCAAGGPWVGCKTGYACRAIRRGSAAPHRVCAGAFRMGCALASDSRGFTSLVLVCDGFHVARLHTSPFREISQDCFGCVARRGGRRQERWGVLREMQECLGCATWGIGSIEHNYRWRGWIANCSDAFRVHTRRFSPRGPCQRNTPAPSLCGCVSPNQVRAAAPKLRVHARLRFSDGCKLVQGVCRGSWQRVHTRAQFA